MLGYKFSARNQAKLCECGVFKDLHVPMLVFQANTLKHIREQYKITRVDFIVLSAGYMIQKDRYIKYFDNPELQNTITGIGGNVLFRSLNRLMKHGLIALKEPKVNKRRFVVTEKGKACIQSYVQYFNASVKRYERDKRERDWGMKN